MHFLQFFFDVKSTLHTLNVWLAVFKEEKYQDGKRKNTFYIIQNVQGIAPLFLIQIFMK